MVIDRLDHPHLYRDGHLWLNALGNDSTPTLYYQVPLCTNRSMLKEHFVFLKHFQHHTVDYSEYAKVLPEVTTVMLSFPSHCSHKLQPLDCSI